VEAALGSSVKKPAPAEANTAAVARKSLVAACDIAAGARLDAKHVAIRRPGTGIPPAEIEKVIGRKAKVSIRAGSILAWEMMA
jgi:N-acetylneuraminate synthase/N,N'-diacetyllegionaminate synthase